ncbi:MAG TPA: hypothetical protein VKG23_19800 [Thermoanaerobaculia bacterium]|nr:hypothetical protein [Thermoanaerobaculia bacterium]
MRSRLWAAAVLLLAAATARSEDGRFDKTIAFPHSGEAKLDWTYQQCTVRGVEVRNFPNEEDIEKARSKDPKDHSWLWWEFHVDNRGPKDCKVRFWVDVLGKDGKVVKSDERSATMDAGKVDDSIRVSGRMLTLEAAEAPKVRVRAEIVPK